MRQKAYPKGRTSWSQSCCGALQRRPCDVSNGSLPPNRRFCREHPTPHILSASTWLSLVTQQTTSTLFFSPTCSQPTECHCPQQDNSSSMSSRSACGSVVVAVLICSLLSTGWASPAPGTQLFSFNEGLLDPGTPGVDARATIYVPVQFNQTIAVYSGVHSISSPPGTLLAAFRPAIPMFNTFFNDPVFVALDALQRVYVVDATLSCVIVLSPLIAASPGALLATLCGSTPTANRTLNQPNGVWVDVAGNIYVIDTNNNRVVVLAGIDSVQPAPGIELFSFSDVNPPFNGGLYGITLDSANRILVAEQNNALIYVLANLTSPTPGEQLYTFNGTSISGWGA